MATLADLAAGQTTLSSPEVEHLSRLVASWSLLSDLSFSDLLLMAAANDGHASTLVVLGQVRPNNRATIVGEDLVGSVVPATSWPLAVRAMETGTRTEGATEVVGVGDVPATFVPVGFSGRPIAVCARLQGPLRGPASLYEQAYIDLFDRLCAMVEDATFPFREADVAGASLPRVGDGIVLVNDRGVVLYATPNATNAMHRLGVYDSLPGHRLDDLGVQSRAVDRALEYSLPVVDEVTRGPGVAILLHCIPLLERGAVTGTLVLVRDVTDVRRLNRVVLSKDQAIQEVHHRVKNNLQTISSLLRLQARRSGDPDSATALLEAERRVRAIAVVHEVLSREPGEEVDFAAIVRALVSMVEDAVIAPPAVEISVTGELGVMGTDVATPLAVVLAELLTNAVEHAFVGFTDTDRVQVGSVLLTLARSDDSLRAEIRDNGCGVAADFSIDATSSLGLSIVRDLVRNQLGGTIEVVPVRPAHGAGTRAVVRVPIVDAVPGVAL